MNPQANNRPLLISLIIIGISIIVLLIYPRTTTPGYSYTRGNIFTASALPLDIGTTTTRAYQTGTYSFIRYIPRTAPQANTYTYYTYPTTSYDSYQSTQYQGTIFSDGCTLTSPFSTTTGEPCS